MTSQLIQIPLESTPVEVAESLAHLNGLAFFDSSGNLPQNYDTPLSIIAAEPEETLSGNISNASDILNLKQLMQRYSDDTKTDTKTDINIDINIDIVEKEEDKSNSESAAPVLPNGGAIGWISYEGDFTFGFYTRILVYNAQQNQWWSAGGLEKSCRPSGVYSSVEIGAFQSNFTEEDYINRVEKIQQYITAGDIYQVNLTQRFTANIAADSLFPLYKALRKSSPAPMASYMNINGHEILSSSPETFVKLDEKSIETRPIKGTRPRFEDPIKDAQSAKELIDSEKERAELIMITDLERNDLGMVCEFGSVKVPELLQLETLEHVYHLVSKVTGTLKEEINHIDALKAILPGGSITGAPKKRAMEIIAELETIPRGIYTGVIGYLGFNQISQFNIAIRTLIREGDSIHYSVGAGIVADSNPKQEYLETLQKAKGIQKALRFVGNH